MKLLTAGSVAVLLTSLVVAQEVTRYSYSWQATALTVDVPGDSVDFHIDNAGPGVDWVLVVVADAKSKIGLLGVELQDSPHKAQGIQFRQTVAGAPVPTSAVTVTPGRLLLNTAADPHNGFLISGKLPEGTRIRVLRDGVVVSDGELRGSLWIRTGVVIPEQVQNASRAMLSLSHPWTPSKR